MKWDQINVAKQVKTWQCGLLYYPGTGRLCHIPFPLLIPFKVLIINSPMDKAPKVQM